MASEEQRHRSKEAVAHDLARIRAEIKSGDFAAQLEDGEVEYAKQWGKSTDARARAYWDEKLGVDRPALPICPYGCGSEGTFLEAVAMTDGRMLGIYTDWPSCSDGCIFVAEIQEQEPPTKRKRKLVVGPTGDLIEVEESD